VEDPGAADVYVFESKVIEAAFEQTVAAQRERYPGISDKAPVFISLDRPLPGSSEGSAPFSNQARLKKPAKIKRSWRKGNSQPTSAKGTPQQESMAQFRERVRFEFAELQGLPVTEVAVEFRILPPRAPDDDNK